MKQVITRPVFWIIFAVLAVISLFATYYYFPSAHPIIHLNLTMNRGQAVTQANELATQFHLGPRDASNAASFTVDEQVKTFVELDAGGKDALVSMMEQNLYQPYNWVIRCFKPFEHNEVKVHFTPDGNPYGFIETISEDTPGAKLSASKAQQIAENLAISAPWNINIADYKLVESSQETRASERIDHTFTFERPTIKIGKGFYRLKLVVSDYKVSKLQHLVKVHQNFIRKYTQMRSANETIAYTANLFMILLYIIGGCFISLFFLFKDRWILCRKPIYWALLIAFLLSCTSINNLPLYWMYYNTAYSPIAFLIQHGISILYMFIFTSIAFALIFMTAESLTRKAFGNQLQLWRLFDPQVASSYTVLGYTVSGYLLVPITLAYATLFWVIMKWFGWWSPSSALFDPNILATYFPWLESITLSLQAGFTEECLFRAIPLASAALLGMRFGKRVWWIAGAFILQAIIFGAAHANYPAQPAYARLVELLADSALFGGVYLAFGLLPGIIAHVLYDVFWFAIPIFVSTAPYAWINQIIVIVLSLIPLAIVVASRLRTGSWQIIPASLYNRAWQTPKPTPRAEEPKPIPQTKITLSHRTVYGFIAAGFIGLALWAGTSRFVQDAPPFSTTRADAFGHSQKILQEKNIDSALWYQMVYPFTDFEQRDRLDQRHRFIWQEGGKDAYHQLINTYLSAPHWIARFVKFAGSIPERTEQHFVYLTSDGSFLRYEHQLAENTPGKSLSEEEAKQIALATIEKQFGQTIEQLNEVSAVSKKQPERLDWTITYSSKTDYPLDQGQARLAVELAGDEVVDAWRYIHVPEQWVRTEENNQLIADIIAQLCQLLIYLITIIGAAIALTQWKASIPFACIGLFMVLSGIFLFELINSWPAVLATFNTSQPFYDQLFRSFGIASLLLMIRAAALTIMFGFVTTVQNIYRTNRSFPLLFLGIGIGTFIAGAQAVLEKIVPSLAPTWANYTPVKFLLPFTTVINSAILNYLSLTILLLLCIITLDALTANWQRRKVIGAIMIILTSLIGSGLIYANNLPLFLCSSVTLSIIFFFSYILVLRFDRSIMPLTTASYVILESVRQGIFNAYPHALISNLVTIIVIAGIAWCWYKKLQQA